MLHIVNERVPVLNRSRQPLYRDPVATTSLLLANKTLPPSSSPTLAELARRVACLVRKRPLPAESKSILIVHWNKLLSESQFFYLNAFTAISIKATTLVFGQNVKLLSVNI